MGRKTKIVVGVAYGCYTVIERVEKDVYNTNGCVFKVICDKCNKTLIRTPSSIIKCPKSCRCQSSVKTHGMSESRIYYIWTSMKERCTGNRLHRYGGRGITVCEEWKNSFTSFYNWAISNGYTEKLTLDRINNDGNYDPLNCRWVTMRVQANNTSKNILITFQGKTQTVSQWARELGLKRSTLNMRLNAYNIPLEKSLSLIYKKKGKDGQKITINGVTKKIRDWDMVYGVPQQLIKNRISVGWDKVLAATTPKSKPGIKIFTK